MTQPLLAAIDQHLPRAVVCCFGAEAAAYRVKAFAAYHADRPPMPDELADQWQIAPSFLESFDWATLDAGELEADDLLGALAQLESAAGGRTLIFSGDRDMFQCACELVAVLYHLWKARLSVPLLARPSVPLWLQSVRLLGEGASFGTPAAAKCARRNEPNPRTWTVDNRQPSTGTATRRPRAWRCHSCQRGRLNLTPDLDVLAWLAERWYSHRLPDASGKLNPHPEGVVGVPLPVPSERLRRA